MGAEHDIAIKGTKSDIFSQIKVLLSFLCERKLADKK